jgi:hypothetical protein
MALPPLWLIYAHTSLRSLPKCDISPRLVNPTCGWSWRLCAINRAIRLSMCTEKDGIKIWSQIIWVQVQTHWKWPTLKLIARPEQSYRLWCILVWLCTPIMRRPWHTGGCCTMVKLERLWKLLSESKCTKTKISTTCLEKFAIGN